jgi:hypothetical protein
MRNTQKKCKENSKIVLRNKTKEEEGREWGGENGW